MKVEPFRDGDWDEHLSPGPPFAVRELTGQEAQESEIKQRDATDAAIERIRLQAAIDERVAVLRRVKQLREQQAAVDRRTSKTGWTPEMLRGHGFDR